MTIKDPDMLLDDVGRSIMVKAMVISAAVHAVVIFGTSFGLYADWAEFGVHSPSTIKLMRKARDEKVEEDARRQAAEARAAQAQEAAVASDGADGATNAPAEAPSAAPAGGAKPGAKTDAAPTAPELEPLPPKSGFTLGEDFNI